MTQLGPLNRQDFPEEIRRVLGQVHHLTFPPQGETSAVAVADTAHGKYVIKRSRGEQYAGWLKQEHKVLVALAQAPFPLPHPYAFVQQETIAGPESWLVMSYLPGEPLVIAMAHETNQAARWSMLHAFGNVLAAIHRHPSLPNLCSDRTLEQAAHNLRHYGTEGSAELLERLQQHPPHPLPSTLIHGDFTVDNVLISAGKVTGIIDWAGGGMGDPRYDLALAIRPNRGGLFHAQEDRQAFFAGYGLSSLSDSDYEYFVDLYEFF